MSIIDLLFLLDPEAAKLELGLKPLPEPLLTATEPRSAKVIWAGTPSGSGRDLVEAFGVTNAKKPHQSEDQ